MDFLGPGIERIYQGVINDVIKQVKEDFEDEGVGEDVLLQLKKIWQHKIIQSGVLNIGPHVNIQPNRVDPPPKPQMPVIKREIFEPQPAPKMVHVKKEKQPNFKLGGAKKMEDSSSEDESVSGEDDDKKLLGYANLGEENSDDADSTVQEDPLNSDDDASSENENTEVYENVPNVVICQFEKVGRTGKKWNFNLSEGVMSINGKDYCFHKTTGDADW